MGKLFLAGLAIALALCGMTIASKAQVNPGFNPDLSWCNVQGSLAIRGPAKWQCLQPGTGGQVLLSGGPGAIPYWNTLAGTGTVTSVQASGGTTGLNFSGGPITGAGTLTLGGFLELSNGGIGPVGSANTVLKSNGTAASWGQIVNADITAGTITNAAINASAAIAVSKLATLPALSVLANITGGSAVPTTPTVTALLDAAFSNTQGAVLFRNLSGWSALNPGSTGEFLQTGGPAANPVWTAVPGAAGGTVTSLSIGAGLTSNNNPITVAGTVTGNAPFRNRIINGDFTFWQRGAVGSAVNGALTYAADRFWIIPTGANVTFGLSDVTANTTFLPSSNVMTVNGAASISDVAIGQYIENVNVGDLGGQDVTFSVQMNCDTARTVGWRVVYPNAVNNYSATTPVASGNFSVTTTPTIYSASMTLPANVANGLGVAVTLNALLTGNACNIGLVQVEPGNVRTPFEKVEFSTSLNRVWRYYEADAVTLSGYAAASADFSETTRFRNYKRRVPTMTNTGSYTNCSFGYGTVDASLFNARCSATSSGVYIGTTAWTADAEIY